MSLVERAKRVLSPRVQRIILDRQAIAVNATARREMRQGIVAVAAVSLSRRVHAALQLRAILRRVDGAAKQPGCYDGLAESPPPSAGESAAAADEGESGGNAKDSSN